MVNRIKRLWKIKKQCTQKFPRIYCRFDFATLILRLCDFDFVILRLFNFNEKVKVFKNSKKLKGTNKTISDDYSQETLKERKLLWLSAQTDKQNAVKVRLVNDELFINDHAYAWELQPNLRVQLPPRQGTSPSKSDRQDWHSKPSEISIINVNARSVVNKTEPLECLSLLHYPHLIVVTETWLNKDISSDEVFPKSFNVLRKDRTARGAQGRDVADKRYTQIRALAVNRQVWKYVVQAFCERCSFSNWSSVSPLRKSHRIS